MVLIPHLLCTTPPLVIMTDLVDEKIIETWTPVSLLELADVNKDTWTFG